MAFDFTSLVPLLSKVVGDLVNFFTKFLTALFMMRQGAKNQELKQAKEELEDVQDAQKLKSHIGALPDSDLDKLL